MIQIIPAILATTEEEYIQKLKKIEENWQFKNDWVQIDLMDNKFVQNKSVGPKIIAKYPTDLKIETQLMVEYPENWIDELIKIPVARIIFPVEDKEGIAERIVHIKNHGIEVGLSLNPETAVETLEPFADTIDLVLVMSVQPGFGGQEFIPESVEKVKKIKGMGWPVKIEVDGGINKEVAKDLERSGADYLVVGSHLWEMYGK
ncbi:ribulose-phosphate 3-epimerase [Candidatus Daviesbacteria bacterium]|nr:ribulose-phosphate 3-epimerase [Candidatus Daviesbacteria bacterium]